jgi:hypothetical protein
MRVLRRTGLLTGALGLAVTTAVVGAPSGASAAQSPMVTTIEVRGTLVVAQSDGPSGGRTSYAVALADGDIVPVRGTFSPEARTGATFDGRLALPAQVTGALAGRTSVTDPRRAALRIVDRRSLTLSVVGRPSVSAVAPAVASVAHQQFVAAIDNKGALGQDDPTLLGHVSTVGTYWKSESNGAISSLVVPATVKHYSTTVATTDCGLGSDFFSLVQEAEAKFPGINPFGGTDQLVLFVSPACQSGGVVGEGTVGSTFASGGALIVKSGDGIDGIYGHETGHNYGFQHANARRSGTSLEYYGVYDVMGFTVNGGPGGLPFPMLNALSTPYRVFQGITDPGEVQDVPLGDQTQPVHAVATIKPRTDGSGVRSVSVVDPDTGETLYLDYRSGGGKDTGSVYALGTAALDTGSGLLHYAPGVVITALRGVGGVDDLVLDAAGHTSLAAGGTWTNASGSLSVHVNALTPTGAGAGAAVTVDFAPSTLPFTTVGTPVIGGTVSVGGTVTLDPGTWSPTPTTTTIRWTAAGSPVPNTDDAPSFVPSPALVGKQLVATVTESAAGFRSTVQSAPVTVAPGTIAVTANPTVAGAAQVGSTLQGHSGTWGSALSTVSSSWQWRADGLDIPGATALAYTVQPGDVGKTLSLAQHLTATGYQATTIVSSGTGAVPAPVISPAPTPTVSGTPRVGAPLQATTGTWMTGVTLSYQWYVGGSPVSAATGPSYTPRPADLAEPVHVAVTGTRPGYPDVTTTSADTAAVGLGVLTATKPTIGGKAQVGRTLTARPGAWTSGTTFTYAWFADGIAIKHATAQRLVLTKAQRGKRITVRVTGAHPGYQGKTVASARTARVV